MLSMNVLIYNFGRSLLSGFASGSFHQAQLLGILGHPDSVLMIEGNLASPPAVIIFKLSSTSRPFWECFDD